MAFGQADELAGVFGDVGFTGPRGDGEFLEEGQFDVGGLDHRVDAANGLGVEGVAGLVEKAQVFGVLWAFTCFEPVTVYRE